MSGVIPLPLCLLAAGCCYHLAISYYFIHPPPLGRTHPSPQHNPSHPPLLRPFPAPSRSCASIRLPTLPSPSFTASLPSALTLGAATLFCLVKNSRPQSIPPSAVCQPQPAIAAAICLSRHHFHLATILGFTAITDPRVRPESTMPEPTRHEAEDRVSRSLPSIPSLRLRWWLLVLAAKNYART